MRGADVIVQLLIEHGIKHIFGVPGDTSMAFHDALRLRANEIEHILCRDERHAAYAADAYARVTGKIGVVEVPSGGGALYAVPGISEANLSNIPLFCIASDISMASDETYALTDCNQEDLFAAVSKWNTKIRMISKIPQMVRKGIRLCTLGVPGAVSISIPEDLLRSEYQLSGENEFYSMEGTNEINYFRNIIPEDVVKKALKLIDYSEKPLVLAGGGVHLSKAYEELQSFVEKFNIPVVTSIDGKGSISEYSEYCLGTVGANGFSKEANLVMSEADLLIILGSKLDNVTTMGKKIINPNVKVIQIDINENVIGNILKVDCPVMGDIKMFLQQLARADVNIEYKFKFAEWVCYTKKKREEKFERIKGELDRESEYVIAAKVFDVLNKITDEETIFLGDAGTPTPYISSHLRQKKAGKYCIIPRSHGSLGYALGAAIGAQIGKPESKVISMFGDGSFGMALGELETAKRLNLPIVFINFQNDSYGWIKTIQRLYYDEAYFGVDFSPIDAVKIAEGFGIQGKNIKNNYEIEDVLKWAINQNSPVFINVIIEPPSDYVPPVYQWEMDVELPPDKRKKLVY